MASGGGGDKAGGDPPATLQLLPPVPPPLPKPASKTEPKGKPVKKFKPKTHGNLSEEEVMAMKARTHKWVPWSLRCIPAGATIPCIPHVLCEMHGDLLKQKAFPVDDIYSELPCTIVGRKRFNLKDERGYLLFGKRNRNRKFVSQDLKDKCLWREEGGWDKVAGPDGWIVGIHFKMALEFLGKNKPASEWTADEYLSVESEAGDSSLVVLKCKNREWESVESQVEVVEALLLGLYQDLVTAKHEGATNSYVEDLKSRVVDTQIQLGFAITKFEKNRIEVKASQDSAAGVQGFVVDDTVSVELSLALPGGNCSGAVSFPTFPTFGAYYKDIDQKKVEEKMTKSKKGCSSSAADLSAADNPNILVGTVAADHSVPDRDDYGWSAYAARFMEREHPERNAKGKEKMEK